MVVRARLGGNPAVRLSKVEVKSTVYLPVCGTYSFA
jgi:hypothetical protein